MGPSHLPRRTAVPRGHGGAPCEIVLSGNWGTATRRGGRAVEDGDRRGADEQKSSWALPRVQPVYSDTVDVNAEPTKQANREHLHRPIAPKERPCAETNGQTRDQIPFRSYCGSYANDTAASRAPGNPPGVACVRCRGAAGIKSDVMSVLEPGLARTATRFHQVRSITILDTCQAKIAKIRQMYYQ